MSTPIIVEGIGLTLRIGEDAVIQGTALVIQIRNPETIVLDEIVRVGTENIGQMTINTGNLFMKQRVFPR